ncbi:MAG TPA: hypothetical protein VIJ91_14160 [Candidatus Dormibacteraeota bacterium]
MAALRAIVRCDLAVVDCSYATVCGPSALRCRPRTCICRALTIARRAITCCAVEITRRVVARFGVTVAQPGRDVAITRCQTSLPTSHRRLLVGPRIFAVLRRLGAIFGCDFAVVDGSNAAVGSFSAPRVGPSTFVSRALSVARRTNPRSPIAITRRIVTRFGLSITQAGRDVPVTRSQTGLPTAHSRQLVGAGILAVPRRMCAIVRRNFAVVDGPLAAIRGISTTGVGPCAFVCCTPAIARRAISCNSVELSGRVVTRFGVSVTLFGGEVSRPRCEPRIFAILGGLGTILGCKSAVVDGLGAVIGSLGTPQGGLGAFVGHAPAIARGAIPGGSVEITRRVVTRFGLSVTKPGRDITVLSSHPRLSTAHACQLIGS